MKRCSPLRPGEVAADMQAHTHTDQMADLIATCSRNKVAISHFALPYRLINLHDRGRSPLQPIRSLRLLTRNSDTKINAQLQFRSSRFAPVAAVDPLIWLAVVRNHHRLRLANVHAKVQRFCQKAIFRKFHCGHVKHLRNLYVLAPSHRQHSASC